MALWSQLLQQRQQTQPAPAPTTPLASKVIGAQPAPTAPSPTPEQPAPQVFTKPEEQMPQVQPEQPQAQPGIAQAPWQGIGTPDVDHYGLPGYTAAQGSFGTAPSGWDPAKWNDPLHQTPKYVWGRIFQEAAGQDGQLDLAERALATARLEQAYPGLKVHDDLAITPWGERVDIFTDFGDSPQSKNGISWGVEGAGAAAAPPPPPPPQFSTMDFGSGMSSGGSGGGSGPTYQQYSFGAPSGSGGATSSSPSALSGIAGSLVQKLANTAEPNVDAMKESQKELLNRLRYDAKDAAAQSAASRGVSGGWLMGRDAEIDDEFSRALTGAYRGVELDAAQQAFEQLLAASGQAQGLESLGLQSRGLDINRELGLGQLALGQGRLGLDSELGRAGIALDRDRLAQSGSQFDRTLAQSGSQFDRTLGFNQSVAGNNANQAYWDFIARTMGF